MHRNNDQYKVGDKILVKRKKNYKHEIEIMGPFLITQLMTISVFASKNESAMMPPIFTE